MNITKKLALIRELEPRAFVTMKTRSCRDMDLLFSQPGINKYALWLMTGKIAPSAGQINPDIAHSGLNVTSW